MDGSSANALKYCEEIMKLERARIISHVMMPDVKKRFQWCCELIGRPLIISLEQEIRRRKTESHL